MQWPRGTQPMRLPTEAGNATVLFVEDDCAMLSLGKIALEATGYTVIPAANGKEAVTQFRASHGDIDFAVVDLLLPDMHGTEVIRHLVAIDDRVPIIVATGLNREDADTARKAGAIDIISKPYSISNLHEHLSRLSPLAITAAGDA
jgi:DNA-binding response OmpR family regulator